MGVGVCAAGGMMSDTKKIDQINEVLIKIDKDNALQKVAFEAHTQQDEKMYEELKRMNAVLDDNTGSLKEHIQNNVLLKDMLKTLNRRLDPIELKYIQQEAVRAWIMAQARLIAKLGAASAVLYGGFMWLQHLIK
jgi:tetrahydrodipicolinate N-succinyltransferase